MVMRCNCPLLVFCFVLLAFIGCKRRDAGAPSDPQSTAISAAEIDKVVDVAARGMREVSLGKINGSHRGQECVLVAHKPEGGLDLGKTPPPRGMIRIMGQTVICRGELTDISADSITVQAPYPTPGSYKTVEIAKEDIQSVHIKL